MSFSAASRRKSSIAKRAGLTLMLGLGALAVVPAIASASTVSIAGTTITFAAAGGETNGLTVTVVGANYVFTDGSGPDPTAGAGCADGGATVTCPTAAPTSVVINLNDNDDTFTATGVNIDPFTVNAGDDNDQVTGSSANDIINGEDSSENVGVGLNGGPGNDTINGGAGIIGDIVNGDAGNDLLYGGTQGAETLSGGSGNDRLEGGDGNDVFNGGADLDRVTYGTGGGVLSNACADSISVDIDNVADDGGCNGEAAENVQDSVESITGSNIATDTITGSCGPNTIAGDTGTTNGGAGAADTINGDPAACAPNGGDFLGGGEGNDSFNCDGTGATPGFDTVTYGTPFTTFATGLGITLDDIANDNDGFGNVTENVQGDCERIIGSPGADTIDATGADQAVQLFGRAGNDVLTDSAFNDTLNGEADTDTGNCINGGTDTALNIEINNGCEL